MNCPSELDLSLYADGELTINATTEIEAHLGGCAVCRAQDERFARLSNGVRGAYPVEPAPHLASRVLATLEPERRGARRWAWALALLAAPIAVVVLRVEPSEWTARGGVVDGGLSAHRVGVEVMIDGRRAPPGALIPAEPGFTFTVYNRTQIDLELMLFAIDAEHEVHWLYPAYVDPDSDPRSVTIPGAESVVPLPEGVRPDRPAPGPLSLVSVFSPTPLHVQAIESELAGGIEGLQRAHPLAIIAVEAFEVSP